MRGGGRLERAEVESLEKKKVQRGNEGKEVQSKERKEKGKETRDKRSDQRSSCGEEEPVDKLRLYPWWPEAPLLYHPLDLFDLLALLDRLYT